MLFYNPEQQLDFGTHWDYIALQIYIVVVIEPYGPLLV